MWARRLGAPRSLWRSAPAVERTAVAAVLTEQPCDMKRANHPPAERTTLAVQQGVLGFDFSVDHLTLAETDLYGSMLRKLRLPPHVRTPQQRNAVLSDALSTAGGRPGGHREVLRLPARVRIEP